MATDPLDVGKSDASGMHSASRQVGILGTVANEATVLLVEGLRRLGIDASLLAASDVLTALQPDDIVVGRLDVLPGLDGVEPGLLALLLLERRGLDVINCAPALLDVHDKLRTARRLAAAGVPHPRTVAVTRGSFTVPLAPPLVLKPRFGSWGRDVFACENLREAEQCLEAVRARPWFRRHGAIAQEWIPPQGHDLRVVVAGGVVVGAGERIAAPGEWRTNISLGGSARPTTISDDVAELARTAAAAVAADLVGVDLLPLADGSHVVLELNGAVEFDPRYALAGRDIYEDVARALRLEIPSAEPAVAR